MIPCPQQIDRIMCVMDGAFDPVYGEAWTRKQIADALALPNTHALVIDSAGRELDGETPGQAAGFVLTRHAADEEELLLIAVLPDCRNKGLASILIDRLFHHARDRGTDKIFLEMRRGNPALHLYRKKGFGPIGERPDYYLMADGSRIDAITFGRTI